MLVGQAFAIRGVNVPGLPASRGHSRLAGEWTGPGAERCRTWAARLLREHLFPAPGYADSVFHLGLRPGEALKLIPGRQVSLLRNKLDLKVAANSLCIALQRGDEWRMLPAGSLKPRDGDLCGAHALRHRLPGELRHETCLDHLAGQLILQFQRVTSLGKPLAPGGAGQE